MSEKKQMTSRSKEEKHEQERGGQSAGELREGTPVWVMPTYIAGLVVLLVSQRVLDAWPTLQMGGNVLGTLAVLVATAARFVPTWRAGGERAVVEKWMGVVSVAGLVALALYFVTTPWATEHLSLLPAQRADRERAVDLLTVVWIALLTLSVLPMVFAEVALYPMRDAELIESGRVKAAMLSGFTLAMALVYGSLFVYGLHEQNWKVDFSYFRTARPSESTVNIARSLPEPVRVLGFFPQVNDVRVEVLGYLKELNSKAPKVRVEMHDRLLEPKLARDMHANEDGVLILTRGEARRTLRIGTEMKSARPALKDLDRDFQEQLLKLAREKRKAYLTVGHGELNERAFGMSRKGRSGTIVKRLLERQNYDVRNLGLSNGLGSKVPDDADVVIVLGPQEPFAPEEIRSLAEYTKHGGKLFLALDPDVMPQAVTADSPGDEDTNKEKPHPVAMSSSKAPASPVPANSASAKPAGSSSPPTQLPKDNQSGVMGSLEQLAKTVGVRFVPVPLVNLTDHLRRRFNASDGKFMQTNGFSSHASVTTLSRNASRAAIVFDGAGYLEPLTGSKAKVDFAVRTLPRTFADKNLDFRFDPATETRKTYYIGAAITGLGKAEDSKKKDVPKEQRAFVFADADAFSDAIMARVLGNQVLFVDAVRWLVGEESFAGEVNSEKDVRIQHTKKGDQVWFYATIFGAPLFVLLAGVWLSRWSRRSLGGAA